MPYDDPDPSDPMTLHGMVLDDEGPTPAAMREMAECFAEEYARLGFDRTRILKMFTTKGYAGPFMAHEMLGATEIAGLVDDVLMRWGPRRSGVPPVEVTGRGDIALCVIE